MPRNAVRLLLPAMLVAAAGPALAQGAETGIRLSVADWIAPWNPETGGWTAVPAGEPAPVKGGDWHISIAAELAPGRYDVYWDQNDATAPLLVATDIDVAAGAQSEVPVNTGIALETAAWVPSRQPDGWFGAIVPDATTFDFVNVTPDGNGLFLPAGDYEVFYQQGNAPGMPATWLGVYTIEAPYGGLGIEVYIDDDGEVVVVQALPGTGAEAAGIVAEDVILTVDGVELTGMTLEDAVAAMRGPAGTDAALTIKRGKETIELSFQRMSVDPVRTVAATSGIRLSATPDAIGADGWWGVVFAGETPTGFDDLVAWRVGGTGDPLLLGPTSYDVYWNPDGQGQPDLIAADVVMDGTLIDIGAPDGEAKK